jgi:hypothetical protein
MDLEGTLAIAAPFVTAILIVITVFVSKVVRDRSRDRVIMRAVECGKELSPDLFTAEKKKAKDPLTSALVTIGVGISLFIALYLFFDQLKFAAFAFIPLFVGLGQLTGYLINKRKSGNIEEF